MSPRTLSGIARDARAKRSAARADQFQAWLSAAPKAERVRWVAQALVALKERAMVRPAAYYKPTPPQRAFHTMESRAKLLRGANQIGKTTCAVLDIIWRCTDSHPFVRLARKPPIRAWIVVHSWEQSLIVQ